MNVRDSLGMCHHPRWLPSAQASLDCECANPAAEHWMGRLPPQDTPPDLHPGSSTVLDPGVFQAGGQDRAVRFFSTWSPRILQLVDICLTSAWPLEVTRCRWVSDRCTATRLRELHQRRHAHPQLGNYMSDILVNYVSGTSNRNSISAGDIPTDDRKITTARPALDSGTGAIAPLRRHRADLRTCTS